MWSSPQPARHAASSGSCAAAIVSGLAGAATLTALDRGERLLLGRPAVYASSEIAARLARRYLHRDLGARAAAITGLVLRGAYATALAAAYAAARPRLAEVPRAGACAFSAAIATGELAVLPRVGAAPAVARWSRFEPSLLYLQAMAFTAVAEVALRMFAPRSRAVLGSGRSPDATAARA